MPWVYLMIAAVFEVAWAIGLKYTDGFKQPVASVLTVIGMIASFYMLALAVRQIPIGTGYAVWTGIGAVGVALFGMIYLGDPVNLPRIACLLLIVVGIVGLKLASG